MLDIRFERAAYFGRRDFFCRMVSISYGSRDGWKHAPPSTRCELLVCELAVVFEQTVLLSQFPYLLFEWPTFCTRQVQAPVEFTGTGCLDFVWPIFSRNRRPGRPCSQAPAAAPSVGPATAVNATINLPTNRRHRPRGRADRKAATRPAIQD
jgi:hypothetical protein